MSLPTLYAKAIRVPSSMLFWSMLGCYLAICVLLLVLLTGSIIIVLGCEALWRKCRPSCAAVVPRKTVAARYANYCVDKFTAFQDFWSPPRRIGR